MESLVKVQTVLITNYLTTTNYDYIEITKNIAAVKMLCQNF